jgi:glyoxylase-like metal-dependent hydrolase (beta-lactamase superfamily II)
MFRASDACDPLPASAFRGRDHNPPPETSMAAAADPAVPDFDRSPPANGLVEAVSPLIRRLIAPNPGPFTFTGTCTYIVGRGTVAVIDPGPEDSGHLAALTSALAGETVSHIVVTHTHRDHSPGARGLAALTGAPIVGCGPHRAARPPGEGEQSRLDAGGDSDHAPSEILAEGDRITGGDWTLVAVETPGHTANHLAFALPEDHALFSGDHVMAWSTSVVAPPDGSMRAYMASLDKLRARAQDRTYWPGHGGPVREPARFVRALAGHRRQREAAILRRLGEGDRLISEIVPKIYDGLDKRLQGAAALSVFAHLEDLVDRGIVTVDGALALASPFRLA